MHLVSASTASSTPFQSPSLSMVPNLVIIEMDSLSNSKMTCPCSLLRSHTSSIFIPFPVDFLRRAGCMYLSVDLPIASSLPVTELVSFFQSYMVDLFFLLGACGRLSVATLFVGSRSLQLGCPKKFHVFSPRNLPWSIRNPCRAYHLLNMVEQLCHECEYPRNPVLIRHTTLCTKEVNLNIKYMASRYKGTATSPTLSNAAYREQYDRCNIIYLAPNAT